MAKEKHEIQNEFLDNYNDAKSELLKIDNVVAVGIGLKEKDGRFTDEISYKVFVPEKKELAELRPDQVVPTEVKKLKTDVITVYKPENRVFVERRDLSEHRLIKGGIAINSSKTKGFFGTLGWFGTLADNTKIILTNKHVLYDTTLSTDNTVHKLAQPMYDKSCCCECNVIGETIIGIKNATVDCAVAKTNSDIDISLVLNNKSTAQTMRVDTNLTATAVVGSHVRKIGARSAFTEGTIVHIGDAAAAVNDPAGNPITVLPGQVLVVAAAGETYEIENGKKAFSNGGDSGSVILNDNDRIVALLWGGDPTTNSVDITFANNIGNVFSALNAAGVPIQLTASPPASGIRSGTIRDISAVKIKKDGKLAFTEETFINNESHYLLKLIKKHRSEVVSLINNCRPVKVAWQRLQGPAFTVHFINSAKDPAYFFPKEVKGISLRTMLTKMSDILQEHGSLSIKNDIEKYGTEIINMADKAGNVEEIVAAFNEPAMEISD